MWIVLLIVIALIAANLPWLTDRIFLFAEAGESGKSPWWRLLEWLVLYFIVGGLAVGIEIKTTGGSHAQGWEFYAISFCLFLIFALPGFIFRHDLKDLLDRRR